jgi:hypothetical protein
MGLYLEEALQTHVMKRTIREKRKLMAKYLKSQRSFALLCPRPSRLIPRSALCRDFPSDYEDPGLGPCKEKDES